MQDLEGRAEVRYTRRMHTLLIERGPGPQLTTHKRRPTTRRASRRLPPDEQERATTCCPRTARATRLRNNPRHTAQCVRTSDDNTMHARIAGACRRTHPRCAHSRRAHQERAAAVITKSWNLLRPPASKDTVPCLCHRSTATLATIRCVPTCVTSGPDRCKSGVRAAHEQRASGRWQRHM